MFEVRDRARRTLVSTQDRAVRVRERDPDDRPSHKGGARMEPSTAREADRAPVDPVVGPREGEGTVALLRVVRELHGRLDGVAPGDREEDAGMVPEGPGQRRFELLEEVD